jgi:hypothetical protein
MKIAPVVDVGVFFYLGIILATTSLERREVRRRAIGAHYTQPRGALTISRAKRQQMPLSNALST